MALFFSSSLDSSLCSRGERRQGQQLRVALPCVLESRRHSVLTPDLCQPREKSKAVDVVLEDPRTQEKVNTGAFSPSGPKDKPTREQGRRRCGNGGHVRAPNPHGAAARSAHRREAPGPAPRPRCPSRCRDVAHTQVHCGPRFTRAAFKARLFVGPSLQFGHCEVTVPPQVAR